MSEKGREIRVLTERISFKLSTDSNEHHYSKNNAVLSCNFVK